MTELLIALAPIVAGTIAGLRWPTLTRRIREHTALLRDMPDHAAAPLRQLLADEVEQLVAREQRRLEPRVNRWLIVQRLAVVVGGTIVATAAVISLYFLVRVLASAVAPVVLVTTALTLLVIVGCGAIVLTAVIARHREEVGYLRRRAGE